MFLALSLPAHTSTDPRLQGLSEQELADLHFDYSASGKRRSSILPRFTIDDGCMAQLVSDGRLSSRPLLETTLERAQSRLPTATSRAEDDYLDGFGMRAIAGGEQVIQLKHLVEVCTKLLETPESAATIDSTANSSGLNIVMGLPRWRQSSPNVKLAHDLLFGPISRLDELFAADVFKTFRSSLCQIAGALTQIFKGEAEKVDRSIADKVSTLKGQIDETRSTWSSFTCYPDVVQTRRILNEARGLLDKLDPIALSLTDHTSVK